MFFGYNEDGEGPECQFVEFLHLGLTDEGTAKNAAILGLRDYQQRYAIIDVESDDDQAWLEEILALTTSCNMVGIDVEEPQTICKMCSCNIDIDDLKEHLQPFQPTYMDEIKPIECVSNLP